MFKVSTVIHLIISLFLAIQCISVQAVTNDTQMALELMQDQNAQGADLNNLKAEAGTFEAIRLGLALSLARCEGKENCEPSIDEGEMDYLLDALQLRVDDVSNRLDSEEDAKQGEQVLAIFENELDSYFYYYDSIRALSGEDLNASISFADDNFGLTNEIAEEEDFYEDEGPSIEELIMTELEFYKDEPINNDDDLGIYESDYSTP